MRTFSISQTEIFPAHMVMNILDMPIPLQRRLERVRRRVRSEERLCWSGLSCEGLE